MSNPNAQTGDPRAAELLRAIERAFADVVRPEHFTNYEHCDECFEHDETLRGSTPATIGLAELGNGGWDPICYISVQGFHYYFPALARLALGQDQDWYLDQFLFHLQWPPERISDMTSAQRAAVRPFLEHLFESRFEELGESDREQLLRLIEAATG